MRAFLILTFVLLTNSFLYAQDKDQKLVIITTDGFRWQELFKGIDSTIAKNSKYNQGDSTGIFNQYWDVSVEVRRQKLMPFFWNVIAKEGQLFGNRAFENNVDNANPYWFSYPGYSEILTGHVDTLINSNEYPPNPHTNVLEFFNKMPNYKGKVAAFGAWNAFDRILNEKRAGFPVVNAFDDNSIALDDPTMKLLNEMNKTSFKPFDMGECQDVFTHFQALHYLKTKRPKIFYISYGETDEFAHAGHYKYYLNAAHQFDEWVGQIWNWLQSDPDYKGKTTLLITTDHGRGDIIKSQWTSHGQGVKDAYQIWFALIGPKVKALGEVKSKAKIYQKQLAATATDLVGYSFKAEHEVAPAVQIEKK